MRSVTAYAISEFFTQDNGSFRHLIFSCPIQYRANAIALSPANGVFPIRRRDPALFLFFFDRHIVHFLHGEESDDRGYWGGRGQFGWIFRIAFRF